MAVGCGDPKDRVAVDLIPGAEKRKASAVRIGSVIRIESVNRMGFRLDIMSSENAQGGLPGWDRNPELPAALCKRKNSFKQSGKRLPRSPKISRRRAPKLGREDGQTPSVFGTFRPSRRKAGIKKQKQGGSGKGPDEKGPYRRPRHYRSKSFKKASGRYRLQRLPSTVKNEFVVPSIRDGKG